jgi:hypothetical protein
LVEAVTLVDHRIDAANARLPELRDAAEQSEGARQARSEVDVLAPVIGRFREVSTQLTAAIDPLTKRISSAADFLPRIELLLADIASASDNLAQEGRDFAARMEAGTEPVGRPAPPLPEPAPAPVIPRERVYCLAPVSWREGSQVRCSPRYSFVELPSALVEQALTANLIDRLGTERCERMVAAFGVINGPASPDQCILLDAPPAAEQPAPHTTLPPGVIEERRGEPRTMEISVNRI